MDTTYVFLNDRVIPESEAALSLRDIGVLRGYAVFDLLRTVNGRPFLLAEHLERLHASAARLGLRVPVSDERIAHAIDELLARNGHAEATVRLVLTGGVSPDGMGFDPETPTFFILTHELHEPPASLYQEGGALLVEEHLRELPEAKTTNYLTMLRNRSRIAENGALDLLYHRDGRVFEAASASVYFVHGSTIFAPGADVLHGTVGSLVLEAARGQFEVVRGDVTVEQAFASDEVFLTSTTRGVVPIVRLGEQTVGNGSVGPVTTFLMQVFRDTLAGA